MTPTAFGTLMALEPAIGLALGLIVLSQHPSASQLGSIALVVFAGAGAQRGGRRPVSTNTTSTSARQEHVVLPVNTMESA